MKFSFWHNTKGGLICVATNGSECQTYQNHISNQWFTLNRPQRVIKFIKRWQRAFNCFLFQQCWFDMFTSLGFILCTWINLWFHFTVQLNFNLVSGWLGLCYLLLNLCFHLWFSFFFFEEIFGFRSKTVFFNPRKIYVSKAKIISKLLPINKHVALDFALYYCLKYYMDAHLFLYNEKAILFDWFSPSDDDFAR